MTIDTKILRDAQLRMLDILIVIDKICQKHNIKYFLMYGTLLGAVRHKGFIPWDDDCDIAMMREDYKKFCQVIQQELPEKYFFQNTDTDKYYKKRLAKIRDINSLIVEHDESEHEKYNQGLFVDIFVFDYYVDGDLLYKLMTWGDRIKDLRKVYPKGSLKRNIVGAFVNIPYALHKIFEIFLLGISKLWRENKSLDMIDIELKLLLMFPYVGHEKSKIFPLKKYEFEGNYFYGPNDYDYVLTKQYGDYMQIPPVDQRIVHAKKIIL